MISDRGAVAAALEQWNERRRRMFYPKTDFDFDLDALRRRKEELSKIDLSRISAILNQEVWSIEFLSNAGTFHALFRIKTHDENWILKLSPDEIAPGFAIEKTAMTFLQEHGLPSLQIAALEEISNTLPCPFIIMEEARGRILTSFENPGTQALPEPLLFEFGRTLARIHNPQPKENKTAGLLGWKNSDWVGLQPSWSDYLLLRLDEHLEVCRSIGAIDYGELNSLQRLFSKANLGEVSPRLLHGDPGHHNVFSDGERITAIIDWEDALCGDPVFDIAFWGTFVRDEMRAPFLEGYETVENLPSDFEYRYWLYYLRIALSKTVHRFRFGTKDRPGRPPASRRIQKALSKLAEL